MFPHPVFWWTWQPQNGIRSPFGHIQRSPTHFCRSGTVSVRRTQPWWSQALGIPLFLGQQGYDEALGPFGPLGPSGPGVLEAKDQLFGGRGGGGPQDSGGPGGAAPWHAGGAGGAQPPRGPWGMGGQNNSRSTHPGWASMLYTHSSMGIIHGNHVGAMCMRIISDSQCP